MLNVIFENMPVIVVIDSAVGHGLSGHINGPEQVGLIKSIDYRVKVLASAS